MFDFHLCWAWRYLGEATLRTKTRCYLCQACGCLIGDMSQAKTGYHLCQGWGQLLGVTKQVETGRHLCWAWGRLSEATVHTEACHCSSRVQGQLPLMWNLQTFEKICSTRLEHSCEVCRFGGKYTAQAEVSSFGGVAPGRGLGQTRRLDGTRSQGIISEG